METRVLGLFRRCVDRSSPSAAPHVPGRRWSRGQPFWAKSRRAGWTRKALARRSVPGRRAPPRPGPSRPAVPPSRRAHARGLVRRAPPSPDRRREVRVACLDATTETWVTHARATVSAAPVGPPPHAEAWPPPGTEPTGLESFYEDRAAAGYGFRPAFRNLRAARRAPRGLPRNWFSRCAAPCSARRAPTCGTRRRCWRPSTPCEGPCRAPPGTGPRGWTATRTFAGVIGAAVARLQGRSPAVLPPDATLGKPVAEQFRRLVASVSRAAPAHGPRRPRLGRRPGASGPSPSRYPPSTGDRRTPAVRSCWTSTGRLARGNDSPAPQGEPCAGAPRQRQAPVLGR